MDSLFRLSRSVYGSGVAAQALPGAEAADAAVARVSFEEFYAATFPRVYAFIRSQVASADTAQELVSRVFLKAYRHRAKAPADGAATQWVFRIAQTTLIDYWRVERKRELASVPIDELTNLTSGGSDAESAYARKERSTQLLRLVGELAEADRTILALKFTAQQTNREIATILATSEAAVSMRLLRALRRLRERLKVAGWQQ
jgi:RNA polymerase sigma-70 factor (ECF subfamily)